MNAWLDETDCSCACHTQPGIKHAVACCSGLPIDFWEEFYDPHFVGNDTPHRPKQRSALYEPIEDWLSYVQDKKTGKPVAGPNSDRIV